MFCKVDCQLELEGKRTVLRERNVTEARGGKEEREQEFLVRTFLNSLRVVPHLVLSLLLNSLSGHQMKCTSTLGTILCV